MRLFRTSVAGGFPDSRTCLLHQKLQMLNICMERRTLHAEGGLPFPVHPSGTGGTVDSDEEFFDCSGDDEDGPNAKEDGAGDGDGGQPLPVAPVGRLSRLGTMLLVHTDEPLYIPVTQEPVPKTEDQLEDDAEVMLKLGPGSELCAQMMSASLLSDMESFRAANPAARLEDFIRWYSPRDWIEDDPVDGQDPFGRRGRLSTRMLIPGNTWQTVWDSARAVPARRQKRLFDDTREAEKVLHFLESRTIGQIAQLTMATLFHGALIKLTAESRAPPACGAVIPGYGELLERITTACCKLSRENWTTSGGGASRLPSATKYEQLLNELQHLECAVTQVRSLRWKLFATGDDGPGEAGSDSRSELVLGLLGARETNLPGGARHAVAVRVMGLFAELNNGTERRHRFSDTGTGVEQQQQQPAGGTVVRVRWR